VLGYRCAVARTTGVRLYLQSPPTSRRSEAVTSLIRIAALVFLLLLSVASRWLLRTRTPNKSSDLPRCLNCEYVLDHLPESRRPECGQNFDASDSATFLSPGETRDGAPPLLSLAVSAPLICVPVSLVMAIAATIGLSCGSLASSSGEGPLCTSF